MSTGAAAHLSAEEREAVREFIRGELDRGHQNAGSAHRAMGAKLGVSLHFNSFLRYWREQVERPGDGVAPESAESAAPPLALVSADALASPPASQTPAVASTPAPRKRETQQEEIAYRSARGSFSARPGARGWQVTFSVADASREVALSLMGQATALLFPQPGGAR